MKFDTLLLQHAHTPSENRNCITVPIFQTSAFSFNDVQYAQDLFDLKVGGDIYTRLSNPTTQVLEERIAAIEGGVGALCTSSGQSASLLAILNISNSGNNIVASENIYGGTVNLLGVTLKKMGIETRFVKSDSPEEFESLIDDKTTCLFIETLNNPSLKIADIEPIAKVAHKYNIPLIADNTIPTPYLLRPFEYGADIIVHSTTKYISGHGNAMGGAIVDSGNFDWKKSGKFPELVEPDASYHGLSYTDTFKNSAFIVKARAHLLRDIGATASPMNSYLTLLGLETLHVRMQRYCETALKVAKYLEKHPKIEWVNYPLLEQSTEYKKALKYLPNGASSIVSFGVKGGRKEGTKFIENCKLLIHATNIGDTRSIITYPALTTHRQLSDEQMQSCGIGANFMRLSVGLEDVEDIITDIENALSKI